MVFLLPFEICTYLGERAFILNEAAFSSVSAPTTYSLDARDHRNPEDFFCAVFLLTG